VERPATLSQLHASPSPLIPSHSGRLQRHRGRTGHLVAEEARQAALGCQSSGRGWQSPDIPEAQDTVMRCCVEYLAVHLWAGRVSCWPGRTPGPPPGWRAFTSLGQWGQRAGQGGSYLEAVDDKGMAPEHPLQHSRLGVEGPGTGVPTACEHCGHTVALWTLPRDRPKLTSPHPPHPRPRKGLGLKQSPDPLGVTSRLLLDFWPRRLSLPIQPPSIITQSCAPASSA
jgi:hypothetical protein